MQNHSPLVFSQLNERLTKMKTLYTATFVATVKVAASALAVLATECLGGELEVSPDGMSPHDALLAIRAAKACGDKGAWTVRVKEGLYTLNETLVFTPEDSGEPDAPVTWIGDGDNTVFAGGRRLTG